jgi:hypothetical protein
MTVPGTETVYNFKDLLAQAKTASFEALPIGDYDVEIHEATATISSTQKPMIKIKAKVITGPHTKRTVMTQFVLSVENAVALNIFFRNLRAFGLTDEWLTAIGGANDLTPIAQALVGRKARFTLGQKQYQGETRNEVNGVKPMTGAPAAPPQSLPGSGLPGAGMPTGGVTTPPAQPAAVAQPPAQPPSPPQDVPPAQPAAAPVTPPPPPAQQAPAAQPAQQVAATPPPPPQQPAAAPVQDAPAQPPAQPETLSTPPPPPLQF